MSTFVITWKTYEAAGVDEHSRAVRGSVDDIKADVAKLNQTPRVYDVWVELDEHAPSTPADEFRLAYAQYAALTFDGVMDLYVPPMDDDLGCDTPVYPVAYTTTEDDGHDLQVIYAPYELSRVYYVDGEQVQADRFPDWEQMVHELNTTSFDDYAWDCERFGIEAGIIKEED